VLTAAGCGGGRPAPKPAAPAAVDRQVRQVFRAYTDAVAARDFRTACSHLAPVSIVQMRRDAAKYISSPPHDCAALFSFLNSTATKKEAVRIAEVTRTARVRRVVMGADGPVIQWTATVDGKRVPVSQSVRRVGATYKLVSVTR
jgi:hypothetical protein